MKIVLPYRVLRLGYLVVVCCLITAMPAKAAAGTPDDKKVERVCRYVLDHANEGRLDKILIDSAPMDSNLVPPVKEMEEMAGVYIEFRQLIDVNNDGKPERVFISVAGSANFPYLSIYPLNGDQPIDLHTDGPDDGQSDLGYSSFLRHQGKTYMLLHNGLTLFSLKHLDSSNTMKTICNFRQEKNSFSKIRKSENDALCNRFLTTSPDPLRYTKQHSLTRSTLASVGIHETAPSEKAALADIGNDGIERLIVLMDVASGRGSGCDAVYPAVVAKNPNNIDKDLLEKLPPATCGKKIIPFVYKGKTYLGTSEFTNRAEPDSRLRKVEILEQGALRTVCEYEVRPVNFILSPLRELLWTAAENGVSPWQEAIKRPGTDAAILLIKSGMDLNEKPAEHGELPLNEAISAERFDILEMLLKAGANPNLRGDYMTPLGIAVWQGYPQAVSLLLEYGADASDESQGDATAFASAVFYDRLDILRMLLDAGSAITDVAAIDVVTGVQDKNRIEKLKLLLDHGLDVNRQYARYDFDTGIRQEAPGVVTVGPDIRLKLVSKRLVEWAAVGGDAEVIELLDKSRRQGPRGGLIQKLRNADSELNRAYGLLSESLNDKKRSALQEEQQAWEQRRDTTCGAGCTARFRIDWLRNAAKTEERGACVLDMTKQRASLLLHRLLPGIFLPEEHFNDRNQEEWSKEYWRWSKSFPKGRGPTEDATGALCSQKQPGHIWFLTGSSTNAPVQRTCTIPRDTPLFLPVLTSLAEVSGEGDRKCDEMLELLNATSKSVKGLKVEIDHKELPDVVKWRQSTGCFPLETIEGRSYAASDGYWIMLKPLAPGKHDIHIRGTFEQDGFSQDVRYELTVH